MVLNHSPPTKDVEDAFTVICGHRLDFTGSVFDVFREIFVVVVAAATRITEGVGLVFEILVEVVAATNLVFVLDTQVHFGWFGHLNEAGDLNGLFTCEGAKERPVLGGELDVVCLQLSEDVGADEAKGPVVKR